MKIKLKYLSFGLLTVILFSGYASIPPEHQPGFSGQDAKLYLNRIPLEESQAFNNFLGSSQNEHAKLVYLIDRLRESKDVVFIYDRNQYKWTDACMAANWLLNMRYKRGEDARSFLKREISYTPSRSAFIKPPSGPKAQAYEILMNELDRLEHQLQQTVPLNGLPN